MIVRSSTSSTASPARFLEFSNPAAFHINTLLHRRNLTISRQNSRIIQSNVTNRRRFSLSGDRTTVVISSTEVGDPDTSASEVVKRFYGGINGRDLASVEYLIADDCVYEDLVFTRPFVGRKAILEFFNKFINATSPDLQFIIDDISSDDSTAVGVTWHLEWKRKEFPFSKGCSFYRLKDEGGKLQIVYGRDCVEPAIKPGESVLVIIRGITWLLQRFPQLADKL